MNGGNAPSAGEVPGSRLKSQCRRGPVNSTARPVPLGHTHRWRTSEFIRGCATTVGDRPTVTPLPFPAECAVTPAASMYPLDDTKPRSKL